MMMLAAVSLAAPIIVMTSLPHGCLPGTHDAYLHLLRLTNAVLNLKEGVLIPRWGPHLNAGFGYPLGNFYAPGWHIAGGVLVLAGIPAVWVWLLFQTLGILLAPAGGYLFARLFSGRTEALLGAAVCLFVPLRFYEVFVQGNISQLIAVGMIPWVLWSLARCTLAPSTSRTVVAGLLLAGLIMTHHPTAAYAAPLAAVYIVLVVLFSGAPVKRFAVLIAAYALGLLLSAAYWLPALTELKYVNVQAAANTYQLRENFVQLSVLLGPIHAPDRASLNMPVEFSAGQIPLILAFSGTLLSLLPPSRAPNTQRAFVLSGAVVALLCIYLMTYRSLWVWESIPGSRLILFPWRLMGMLSVMLVPGAAFAASAIRERWRSWFVASAITCQFAVSLPLFFPVYENGPKLSSVTPATSMEYEMASGNLGGVATNEYLPRWAKRRPDFSPCPECYEDWQWEIYVNDRTLPAGVDIQRVESSRRRGSRFRVVASEPCQIEWHQMYFPGWRASVDNREVDLLISEPFGLMAVNVPEGSHQVELWYAGTTVQHVGDGLSTLGLLACGGLLAQRLFRRQPALHFASPRSAGATGHAVSLASMSVALVLVTVIQPHTAWFRRSGNMTAPSGMQHTLGAVFVDDSGEQEVGLLGYTLSQTSADYGDWIYVKLFWRALRQLDRPWRAKVTLSDPVSQSEWAVSDHDPPGGFSPLVWPTDKYVVDEHILRVEPNTPPYIADLTVQLYTTDGGHLSAGDSGRVRLTGIRISEKGRKDLPSTVQHVNIVFGGSIRLRAFDLSQVHNEWQLKLFWEILKPPQRELGLMLHVLARGEATGILDQPPIPSYATQDWREGQYLESSINLGTLSGADTLFFGLYDRVTLERLPADVRGGALQTENAGILLPLWSTHLDNGQE